MRGAVSLVELEDDNALRFLKEAHDLYDAVLGPVADELKGIKHLIIAARYAHLADDPVEAASDAVGRHIAAAIEADTSGEVVELVRSQRGKP